MPTQPSPTHKCARPNCGRHVHASARKHGHVLCKPCRQKDAYGRHKRAALMLGQYVGEFVAFAVVFHGKHSTRANQSARTFS